MTNSKGSSGQRADWRRLPLNQIALTSPDWAKRILGLKEFEQPERNISKIESEYNQDKWKRALDYHRETNSTQDPIELLQKVFVDDLETPLSCVIDGNLAMAPLPTIYRILLEQLKDWLSDAYRDSRSIVELGTGFGALVSKLSDGHPEITFVGADYSSNGVVLGNELASGKDNLSFSEFNFYDQRYSLFDNLDGPITVFTVQALEQLYSAEPFVSGLLNSSRQIKRVIHLEPAMEMHGDDLIGMMRRRFLQLNSYLPDLLTVLRRYEEPGRLTINRVEGNVFAQNPFNSLTFVEWTPVRN